MMRAFNEKYLNNAVTVFAEMMDYVVNIRKDKSEDFLRMFIVSGIAKEFERGNPKYVAGKSGYELAYDVYAKTKSYLNAWEVHDSAGFTHYGRSREYWAGWALAHYQWFTAKSFEFILRYISFSDIVGMYPALHEADITKFYSVADSIISKKHIHTNLKRIRSAAGLSQAKLAKETGVSLRSIQMYEQRKKDINKAMAISLLKMSRVLGCEMEDLLE